VNWVLLIAGQLSDKILFDGVGNAEVVLVEVDVALAEPDDEEVLVAALVTEASPVVLTVGVALALLALLALLVLLPLFVPLLETKAPTTPPTTAPMMTSKITDPMMSALRLGIPHQRLGRSATGECCSGGGDAFSGLT
jgi:hypothetical protein